VQTGERAALVSDTSCDVLGRVVSRREGFDRRGQERMTHVALGFMALLLHTKVVMTKIASPHDRGDEFLVELPPRYTIDRIVDDVNLRRYAR